VGLVLFILHAEGVIRIRKSKNDRSHYDKKIKKKRNNDLQQTEDLHAYRKKIKIKAITYKEKKPQTDTKVFSATLRLLSLILI
jgi:hypothetical protein